MLSRADLLGAPMDDDVDGQLKPTKPGIANRTLSAVKSDCKRLAASGGNRGEVYNGGSVEYC